MRELGNILLVSCYEMGHQPWNLASPLAFLEQAGYQPVAVDTAIVSLPDATIKQAQVVAISVPMHTALRLGVMVAERVRDLNPAAHIIFYGLYAWLNQDFLLSKKGDSVIAGEYEQQLVELIQRLDSVGVSPRRGSAPPATPIIKRLAFPVPNRVDLPALDHYARFRDTSHETERMSLTGYVEATRGCLHTCLHCPITPVYKGRFFIVPPEVVLADIRTQVAEGARHITFGDPDFLNGPGHVLKILRAMHAEFPFLTFDATIKIEHILEKKQLLPELRRLGCAFIVSAVESFSDHVLEQLNKGHSAADISQGLAISQAAAIPLRPTFVAFTPWTSLDDYIEMLHAIEQHDIVGAVDPVQYSIRLLIPPNSALLPNIQGQSWLRKLDAAAFTYRWRHPDPRMDQLQQEIASLVEEAANQDEPIAESFYRIKELAYGYAGLTLSDITPTISRHTVPGLTESWFC